MTSARIAGIVGLGLSIGGAVAGCDGDDASPGSASSSSGGSSSGGSSSSSSGGGGGTAVDGLPAGDPDAFGAWLQKKEYTSWPRESAPHESTGPHGAIVLTYLNPALDASLAAKNAEHPAGSAAIKEFLRGSDVVGWAAYVKTQAASDSGRGYYWYEVFDAKQGSTRIEGQGNTTCTRCHSGGADYVLTPYPLR